MLLFLFGVLGFAVRVCFWVLTEGVQAPAFDRTQQFDFELTLRALYGREGETA